MLPFIDDAKKQVLDAFETWKLPWTQDRAEKLDDLDVPVSSRAPSFTRNLKTSAYDNEDIQPGDFLQIHEENSKNFIFSAQKIQSYIYEVPIDNERMVVASADTTSVYFRVVKHVNGELFMGNQLKYNGVHPKITIVGLSANKLLLISCDRNQKTKLFAHVVSLSDTTLSLGEKQEIYSNIPLDDIVSQITVKKHNGKPLLLVSHYTSKASNNNKAVAKMFSVDVSETDIVTLTNETIVHEYSFLGVNTFWADFYVTNTNHIFVVCFGKEVENGKAYLCNVENGVVSEPLFVLSHGFSQIDYTDGLLNLNNLTNDIFGLVIPIPSRNIIQIIVFQVTENSIILVGERTVTGFKYQGAELFYNEDKGVIQLIKADISNSSEPEVEVSDVVINPGVINFSVTKILKNNFRGNFLTVGKIKGEHYLLIGEYNAGFNYIFRLSNRVATVSKGDLLSHDAIAKTAKTSNGEVEVYVPLTLYKGV